ncbi:MAG: DUF2752 domain-containing protein [Verrucomicrobiota bacterium]
MTTTIQRARWKLLALCAAGLGAAAVLYAFEPTRHAFYPQCVLHRATGLACPGCGCLRALHQLSHGNVPGAFAHNPLLVVLLPVLGWLAVRGWLAEALGRQPPHAPMHPAWGWALFATTVVFAVARNLPFSWARWLGP